MKAEETITTEGQIHDDEMSDPNRLCVRCNHFQVCTIHRGVHRALTFDFPNTEHPFETPQLAKICKYYLRDFTV
jgi:hypothetical protein